MLVDFDIDDKNESFHLKFENINFTKERNYILAVDIINCIAGDYSVDPEIEVDDMKDIVKRAKDAEKKNFSVEIHEGGVDIFI